MTLSEGQVPTYHLENRERDEKEPSLKCPGHQSYAGPAGGQSEGSSFIIWKQQVALCKERALHPGSALPLICCMITGKSFSYSGPIFAQIMDEGVG